MRKKYKFLAPFVVIMRLSILNITLAFMTAVSTFALDAEAQELLTKKVTLQLDRVELKSALAQLESAAGVKFVYGTRSLPLRRMVSLKVTNAIVADALDELFRPDKIAYKIVRNRIVLSMASE